MAKQVWMSAGAGATLTALALTVVTPQIEQFEGTKYKAYYDLGKVLTVCSGHTGPDVVVGKVYSPKECTALTEKDAAKAAAGVLKVSPHLLYHPMQLAAAISFSYNVGTGTYANSSVASNFNAGNFQAGCKALLLYTKVKGVDAKGLVTRRNVEYNICVSTLTVEGLKYVGVASS
jgi:lysozyme